MGCNLTVVHTGCFLGTVQIPLPLFKKIKKRKNKTACIKRMRNYLQQLAMATKQCINHHFPVFCSHVLSADAFEQFQHAKCWGLECSASQFEGMVGVCCSLGAFGRLMSSVEWVCTWKKNSMVLVLQRRRWRRAKSTAHLPEVGVSCCPCKWRSWN